MEKGYTGFSSIVLRAAPKKFIIDTNPKISYNSTYINEIPAISAFAIIPLKSFP